MRRCLSCRTDIGEGGQGGTFMDYPVCWACADELGKAQGRISAGEDGPSDLCFMFAPEIAERKSRAVRGMAWDKAWSLMNDGIAKAMDQQRQIAAGLNLEHQG